MRTEITKAGNRRYMVVDQHTYDVLTTLRAAYGVETNAGVIRKALALAGVVARYCDADGILMILDKDGKPISVLLRD